METRPTINLAKKTRSKTHGSVPPSGSPDDGVVGHEVVTAGDDSKLYVFAKDEGALGFEERHVVVVGGLAVAGVPDDAAGGEHGAAAVGVGGADSDAPVSFCVAAGKLYNSISLLSQTSFSSIEPGPEELTTSFKTNIEFDLFRCLLDESVSKEDINGTEYFFAVPMGQLFHVMLKVGIVSQKRDLRGHSAPLQHPV